jgi:type IV pilus assembly protein PilA
MFTSFIERLNDRRDAGGDAGVDAGFTLIELMVVLLILAILLAIAIPTFLGLTGGANDRAAQSNLNTALTNAKSAASENNQTYGGLTAAQLKTDEPAINWVSGPIATNGQVSVYLDPAANGGNGVVLAAWSPANQGTCWFAVDNLYSVTAGAGTPYATAGAGTATSAPTNAGTFYGFDNGAGGAPGTVGAGIKQANCNANAVPANANWNPGQWPTGP